MTKILRNKKIEEKFLGKSIKILINQIKKNGLIKMRLREKEDIRNRQGQILMDRLQAI